MRHSFATVVMLAVLTVGCGQRGPDDAAARVETSSTVAPTTTTETSPTTTVVDQPATTETPVPVDVQACTDSVWSAGITNAGVEPWSSYSGGGQTANCVIVDEAGEDWVVRLTFSSEPWTNDRMAALYDPEWFPITQRSELSDVDGTWFQAKPGSCVNQNGQRICTPANPAAEIADTDLICNGRVFNIGPYTAEGAESSGRPSTEQYRAIQDEVFSKVCATYPAG